MKKIILSVLLLISLNAKVLDKIIATINNMPITSYEVQTMASKMNISKQDALNYLLNQKLIQSEIKKRGIEVDDFEIENAMEKIANQNGMSILEFKNILAQKNELKKLEHQVKENLLKEKLFNQIVQTKLSINPEEIKNYYKTHKNEFKIFKTISAIKYMANNPKILQKIKLNPLSNVNVENKNIKKNYNQLPINLLFLFKQTKAGEYTPIINDGLGYAMYYVEDKNGTAYIPFSEIKNGIANEIASEKREMILKDYFTKLKNRAYIHFYK